MKWIFYLLFVIGSISLMGALQKIDPDDTREKRAGIKIARLVSLIVWVIILVLANTIL